MRTFRQRARSKCAAVKHDCVRPICPTTPESGWCWVSLSGSLTRWMHFMQDPLTLIIVQAVLIIAAARMVGLLARRLEQPMVIAEIVAGIVLGPSLLGLVAPDVTTALFPPPSLKLLGLMSQTGLVLFMFLVGLELDPTMLRG